ncbi:MAG: hypothetical protein ABI700_04575 [Chloroflexota bacterium]
MRYAYSDCNPVDSRIAHENLLIFVDAQPLDKRTQSLWYWVKREGAKQSPREHLYLKGQPGDLFLSKLDSMVIELVELRDDGTVPITTVTAKLSASLDVERVTKRFYTEFSTLRVEFIDLIEGIEREADRFWYASVLLNRLMFVYFLQKKGFIQANTHYLDQKLEGSQARAADRFYSDFLTTLFFEGFAKPEDQRSAQAKALLGPIKYLNGGLFLKHQLEEDNPSIRIPDQAFASFSFWFRPPTASMSWSRCPTSTSTSCPATHSSACSMSIRRALTTPPKRAACSRGRKPAAIVTC